MNLESNTKQTPPAVLPMPQLLQDSTNWFCCLLQTQLYKSSCFGPFEKKAYSLLKFILGLLDCLCKGALIPKKNRRCSVTFLFNNSDDSNCCVVLNRWGGNQPKLAMSGWVKTLVPSEPQNCWYMDVRPTKNISMCIDPYPCLMGKSQFWGDPRVNPSFSTRGGLVVDKPEGPIASRCSSHWLKQNPAGWTNIDVANPWLKPFGKIGLHSCCFFMFFPHLCKRLQDGKRSQDSSPTGPRTFQELTTSVDRQWTCLTCQEFVMERMHQIGDPR